MADKDEKITEDNHDQVQFLTRRLKYLTTE